jgi:ABC-2 type transport system ATP-binding protein
MGSLILEEVSKSYKHKTILDKIKMEFKTNGVFLLAGPNGSGKTTLLESIVGLRSFDSGRMNTDFEKENIAFLFQENNLRKLSTVREELELVADLYHVKEDVVAIAHRYQFEEYLNHKTASLSGGTKRRILIAMTLMTDANVVILDEPASGLDTFNRKEIWNLIKKYGENHIVIVSDHYLNQAAEYSNYVYMMHLGHIVEKGCTKDIITKLASYFYISVESDQKDKLESYLHRENINFTERSTGQNFYFYIKVDDINQNDFKRCGYELQRLSFEDGYLLYTGDDSNA